MLSYNVQTSIGGRKVNEDCANCFQAPVGDCFILCDGLGGHGFGDIASQLVCAEFERSVVNTTKSDPISVLSEALLAAQAALHEKQKEMRCERAMLTTACALIVTPEQFVYSYIGDSRIYFFDEKRGYVRTMDHSVPQMLVASGLIAERAIRKHPDRSRILRAMGTEWESIPFEVAVRERPAMGKGAVLLCTDGLWEWVLEREMIRLRSRSATPEQWLTEMMCLAEKRAARSNMDNHTGIAIFASM